MRVNIPLSDSVNSRIAFMSNQRDGMFIIQIQVLILMIEMMLGLRISLDWDISDTTDFKFTYSGQESDDNRPQEEVSFCAQDQFLVARLTKEEA